MLTLVGRKRGSAKNTGLTAVVTLLTEDREREKVLTGAGHNRGPANWLLSNSHSELALGRLCVVVTHKLLIVERERESKIDIQWPQERIILSNSHTKLESAVCENMESTCRLRRTIGCCFIHRGDLRVGNEES